MSELALVAGRVMDASEAEIPMLDRGYLLGDGVFETLRTTCQQIWNLDAHAARLEHGLSVLGVNHNDGAALLRDAAAALAGAADPGRDHYIRINVSTGRAAGFGDCGDLAVTGWLRPLPEPPGQQYTHGIHVVTGPHRKHTQDPLSPVKTLSFAPYVATRRFATAHGAHDALLLNEHGRVIEASTANMYARAGNSVHAPGPNEGAVAGTTRDVLLDLLEAEGLTVVPHLNPEVLAEADEAWISNTTQGVVPVTKIDGAPVKDGTVGELAKRLHHAQEQRRAP